MQVGKIHAWWLAARSVWITLKYSLKVLFKTYLKKNSRKEIDRLSHDWAQEELKAVNLSFSVFNPYEINLEDDDGSYILMSNHCSHYDIPLMFGVFPYSSIRMITKKELFQVPIWGGALQASEFISVDRKNPRQAIKDLSYAKEKMESGIIPWIAPEGTRSLTGELGPFKQGGFVLADKTKATIVPIGILGTAKVLPPKTCNFSINEHVYVYIGKSIEASQYSNKTQLMKDVESSIRTIVLEELPRIIKDT